MAKLTWTTLKSNKAEAESVSKEHEETEKKLHTLTAHLHSISGQRTELTVELTQTMRDAGIPLFPGADTEALIEAFTGSVK